MFGGICSGRPKRPPTITFAPGASRWMTRPAIRIRTAKRFGSGSASKVTMFSSFQISQRPIGT